MPPPPNSADTFEVHLSNLHARLAATLDALDEMTRNHEAELVELHNQARVLRAKCQIFKSRAKEAEAERDELKSDVNKLVEKEPVPQPAIRIEDVHRNAYIPAILNSLNAELTARKYAVSELQRVSEARIAALEAQVARREAELFSYKPCSCRSSASSGVSAIKTHKRQLQSAGTSLSKVRYTLIEEEMAMRQRTLEVEIDGLRRKLQLAQAETFRSKSPPPAPESLRGAGAGAQFQNAPSLHPTINHIQPEPTGHPVLSDIDRQIDRISKEVETLQAERDNVEAETHTGREDDGGYPNGVKDEDFRGVLLIEEECIRLRNSERSLRQELLLATAAASATEQNLTSLVNKLQRQIHMLRNPHKIGVSAHDQIDMDPEEEFSSDLASEHTVTRHREAPFSTPPLRTSTPSALSSLAGLPSRIMNGDPDSNQSLSSDRPPSAPPFFPRSQHPPRVQHPDTELARIESELNLARSDVREKDQAISTLRAQLAALQQQAVQARTLDGRGGHWYDGDGEKNV